jgi:hypothetical protein
MIREPRGEDFVDNVELALDEDLQRHPCSQRLGFLRHGSAPSSAVAPTLLLVAHQGT